MQPDNANPHTTTRSDILASRGPDQRDTSFAKLGGNIASPGRDCVVDYFVASSQVEELNTDTRGLRGLQRQGWRTRPHTHNIHSKRPLKKTQCPFTHEKALRIPIKQKQWEISGVTVLQPFIPQMLCLACLYHAYNSYWEWAFHV